ncbi:adenylyltransferase/sulfurtransferase MoeZ, partial [Kineococcus sp. R8]|uniref:rhodanese-like domain-containing protein n=1 Tax=Kineococcus siccus TaxID=2696567 RepID=UPI0023F0FD22
VPGCGEAGVLGGVCAAVGSMMVTEAVKLITGAGRSLLGRVLVLDGLAGTWRTLDVRPDPSRPPVTALADGEAAVAVAGTGAGLPTVSALELQRELASAEPPVVVDVREPGEHAASALPGAVPAPLATVLDGTAALPRDRPLVLHCAAGTRSARALRALLAAGYTDVRHLDGGLAAWLRAGGEVEGGAAVSA